MNLFRTNCCLLFFCFCLITLPCFSQQEAYSFFVAGHVYGKPGINSVGFHPPFKAKYNFLQTYPNMEFGVLTGDFAYQSLAQEFDETDAEIDTLGMPVYLAAGNHDYGNPQLYIDRYGISYYHFIHENDLFIVLNPYLSGWSIEGDQLTFLENVLQNEAASANQVFVFFHQVLWWSEHNEYREIRTNSLDGRRDSINFFSEVLPLFELLDKPVNFFSGDVGAGSWASPYSFHQQGNINLISSGMGSGVDDNLLIVEVDKHKTKIKLICLNEGSSNCKGSILAVYERNHQSEFNISLYPNPASEQITIDAPVATDCGNIAIYNHLGQIVYHTSCNYFPLNITIQHLPKGQYILRYKNDKETLNRTFIKW